MTSRSTRLKSIALRIVPLAAIAIVAQTGTTVLAGGPRIL
jgi:hypothetical protein